MTDGKFIEMAKDIEYIKKDLQEINEKLTSKYVCREEFMPIKQVVYALLMLVLTTVLMNVINLTL